MTNKAITLMIVALAANTAMAQPKARRAEAAAKAKTEAGQLTTRAQISFPVREDMSEDVVWRRDVYREIDLGKEDNSPLYYPVEPSGDQMNLFTNIFKLMMTGKVPVYEYRLDGNESFEDAAKVKPLDFLDNYHIFYEKADGRVKLDNSDIPSKEVTAYYVKESAYYDQSTATFHTKVLALCPIMKRQDDFGDGATTYPLFWVKYSDLAPYLAKQTIMTSNVNNAATMTVDDYFTLNKYKGGIYKTNNMLGKTLAQYCTNDTAMAKEQKRIEEEIRAFEENLWGGKQESDSTAGVSEEKARGKSAKAKRTSKVSSAKKETVKKEKKSNSSQKAPKAARVSVRRERH